MHNIFYATVLIENLKIVSLVLFQFFKEKVANYNTYSYSPRSHGRLQEKTSVIPIVFSNYFSCQLYVKSSITNIFVDLLRQSSGLVLPK